ncbi:MAG TPA: hypothetical protein VFI25_10090 [Planctomycetota bacterium]|jgi:hypothetical protein|nr:hypothetical protein [Planctomycetota bacterium]
MKYLHSGLLRGGVALGLVVLGTGAVERLDLRLMARRTDGAVAGRIVSTWTTSNPSPGTLGRVFTHMRIVGEDLYTGKPVDWVVSYFGGEHEGDVQWHADMPTAADVRVGSRVLAFTKWHPTMGGVGMRSLYALFAGIFRLEEGPRGEVVIGRGEGFAVEKNVPLGEFRAQLAQARAARGR